MSDPEALIADYVGQLRRSVARLPAAKRAELLDDITAHLAEMIEPGADESRVRQVLDELGTPEEIAAAGMPVRTSGDRIYDVVTVLVLLLGSFVVPGLGWIAGVVLLWNGPRWNTRQKWIGTLILPVVVLVVLVTHGVAPVIMPLSVVIALAGLVAEFVFLLRAAAQQHP